MRDLAGGIAGSGAVRSASQRAVDWRAAGPAILLAAAVGAWYLRPGLAAWPLLLVTAALLWRALARQAPLLRTPFDLPIALFLLSAGVGVWAAYDRTAAWPRFWTMASTAVLFQAIVMAPAAIRIGQRRQIVLLRVGFALLPAIIALYFLMTNNWSEWVGGKMAWLDPTRLALARWQTQTGIDQLLPGHLLHPNAAGGFLALLLPLQAAALAPASGSRQRLLGGLLLVLSLAALFLTVSRGAWIGLAAAVGLVGIGQIDRIWQPRLGSGRWGRLAFWIGMALLGLLLLTLFAVTIPCGRDCQVAVRGRLGLWQTSWDLAGDTPFTGLGFGSFAMAFSSYVMMVHVGYIQHSHNFFLQLWLEQGALALLALLWLAALAWAWVGRLQKLQPGLWSLAALASFGVILIHGLFDVPFFGRGIQFLFVPLAVLAREVRISGQWGQGAQPWPTPSLARRALAPGLALLGAIGLLLPGPRAAFLTNLGALAQMQVEMPAYHWPDTPIQDVVRRTHAAALAPALAYYQAALALHPNQAAANRRLGQIELSLGQYDAARGHLQRAYAAAPAQQAVRHLLGESYAIAGEHAEAVRLWGAISAQFWWETDWVGPQTFLNRVYWYDSIGEKEKAAALLAVRQEVMTP